MSIRRAEFARLEAAGWTVTMDSPWRRLGAAVARRVGRQVDVHESTAIGESRQHLQQFHTVTLTLGGGRIRHPGGGMRYWHRVPFCSGGVCW